MATAFSGRTELDADLNDTAWYSGDPDLIDVAGLAANLATRLYQWPGGSIDKENQFMAMDPEHLARLVAAGRFAPMVDRLMVRALTEGWTRKHLLAALAKLDSDYRARYAVRAH